LINIRQCSLLWNSLLLLSWARTSPKRLKLSSRVSSTSLNPMISKPLSIGRVPLSLGSTWTFRLHVHNKKANGPWHCGLKFTKLKISICGISTRWHPTGVGQLSSLQSRRNSNSKSIKWIYKTAENLERIYKKMVKNYLPNIPIVVPGSTI